MAEKTSQIFIEVLEILKKNGIPKELLGKIVELMRAIFKKRFKDETKDFSDDMLEKLFPSAALPQKEHKLACKAFTAAAKAILVEHGITPCNGNNHGLCFCGWGGTPA